MKSPQLPLGNNYENTQPPHRFSYANIAVCGSVWHCPVCASKISEKRKNEVSQVLKAHETQGGETLLLTLTLPHRQGQRLKDILDALTKSYGGLTKSRVYRRTFGGQYQLTGTIRALEVTIGDNGWHPHLHVLVLTEKGVDLQTVAGILGDEWRRQVVKQGFTAPNEHGLTLANGDKAGKYVGKWGLEHEVTKGHTKQSRKGATPFDLLRRLAGIHRHGDGARAAAPTGAASGPGFARVSPDACGFLTGSSAEEKFLEYARVFKGRKQLFWSHGLRDKFHLGKERTDEELAEQVDVDATIFARLPLNVWRVILKTERRGEVLDACHHGIDYLLDFLTDLMEQAGELGS